MRAYDEAEEGEFSNVILVEINENQILNDYLQLAIDQTDAWNEYQNILSQIAPYYGDLPTPELNIDSVWFRTLQIPEDSFETDTVVFDTLADGEKFAINGVGFGGNYYQDGTKTIVPYSTWSNECLNCGSAYILEYAGDEVVSLIYKSIEGSHNSWVIKNGDESESIVFVGHDESRFAQADFATASAPSYFYNLSTSTWTQSSWSAEGHHSEPFDYDGDGDDDIFTSGWGDGLGLIQNTDNGYERISLGYFGSAIAPIGFQDDGTFALYLGDAGADEPRYGFVSPYNVVRYYSEGFDSNKTPPSPLVHNAEITPPGYFEFAEFDDVQNNFGENHQNSHEVFSRAIDIDYDGDKDIVVASTLWSNENPYSVIQLLINRDGEYSDETDSRLFNWNKASSAAQMIAFIDVNGDGFVDMLPSSNGFPFNFHNWTIDGRYLSGARVLINDGTGHFVNIAHQQINPFEPMGPGSQYLPTQIPWLNQTGELRWSAIDAPRLENLQNNIDSSTEIYTRKLTRKLFTGPNGIDPAQYGAPGFNEFYYLLNNADVRAKIHLGEYVSGLHHYLDNGRMEGRITHREIAR